MNNNINSNGRQDSLSPEETKAALGIVTRLSEQLMPKVQPEEMGQGMGEEMPPEASQTPEMAPGEEMMPESEEMAMSPENEVETGEPEEKPSGAMGREMDEFKGEVRGIIETKFDDLIKTIKETLKSE